MRTFMCFYLRERTKKIQTNPWMKLMFDQDKYLAGLFEFNNRNLSMKTIPRKKFFKCFFVLFFLLSL